MRALEVTIFMIMVMMSVPLISALGIFPVYQQSNDTNAINGVNEVKWLMSTSQLSVSAIANRNSNLPTLLDAITIGYNMLVFALSMAVMMLGCSITIFPFLVALFGVPAELATWIQIGQWITYALAWAQLYFRGLSWDSMR